MSFEKINEEGLNHNFKITIPASIINEKLDKDLSEIAKTAQLPGFRPGKAPRPLIKRKYGDKVKDDLMNKLISKEMDAIIRDNGYKLASDPVMKDIKDEEDKDFSFTLKLEIRPNFSTDLNWGAIEIKDYKVVLSQEEIDEQIETLYEHYKIFDQECEISEKGCELVIDLHGTIDGEEFDDNQAKDFKIELGKNMSNEDFDKKLDGTKKGQELDVTITLGENWKKNTGKSAIFQVLVKNICKPRRATEAELLDQLKRKTMDEVIEQFKKIVEEETQSQFFIVKKIQLFDSLEKILKFDVPQTMLEKEYSEVLEYEEKKQKEKDSLKLEEEKNTNLKTKQKDIITKDIADNILDVGEDGDTEENSVTANDLSKNKNDTQKDKFKNISEENKKIALRRLRIGLFLEEYSKIYNIKVDAEQMHKFLLDQAKEYGMFEGQMLDIFRKNPGLTNIWQGRILEENVVKHIFENKVKNIEETCSVEEYKKIVSESLSKENVKA